MAGPAPVLCGQTRAFGPSVQGGAPGRIWASSAAPPGCVPASGRSAQAGHVAIPCSVLYVSVLRPWIRPPVLRAGTVHLPPGLDFCAASSWRARQGHTLGLRTTVTIPDRSRQRPDVHRRVETPSILVEVSWATFPRDTLGLAARGAFHRDVAPPADQPGYVEQVPRVPDPSPLLDCGATLAARSASRQELPGPSAACLPERRSLILL